MAAVSMQFPFLTNPPSGKPSGCTSSKSRMEDSGYGSLDPMLYNDDTGKEDMERLKCYKDRTCDKDSRTNASLELATSGFVTGNHFNTIVCPHCRLEVEFPQAYTDMLALHIVDSKNCELALRLLRQRLLEIQTSKGDATGEHSSCEGESYAQVTSTKSQNGEEIPELVTTRTSATDGPADEREDNDGSSEEDKRRHQYDKVASKILQSNSYKLEKAKFHSKEDQSEDGPFYEVHRMSTFIMYNQPNSPRVRLLAFRGQYLYSGNKDIEIRCGFCDFRRVFREEMINSAEAASALDKDHLKNNCCHLSGWKSTSNKPEIWNMVGYEHGRVVDASELLSNESLNGMNKHADLGINLQLAKHTEMAVGDRRIASFLTYPYKSSKHPDALSEAGYFYEGKGDSVTCFSCGIHSADWTSSCNVWERHARSSSHCPFVILQMGQNFIDGVIAEHGPYHPKKQEDKITNVTTRMLRPRMDSLHVQKALDMGLKRESVRTVVGNQIKKGESDFKFIADIARAVNDLSVPESELPNSELFSPSLPKIVKPAEQPTVSVEDNAPSVGLVVVEEMEATIQTDSLDVDSDTPKDEEQKKGDLLESTDISAVSHLIRSQLTCKICMTDIVSIIFLPCGHLTCCATCSAAMVTCPLCRKEVKGTVKVHF